MRLLRFVVLLLALPQCRGFVKQSSSTTRSLRAFNNDWKEAADSLFQKSEAALQNAIPWEPKDLPGFQWSTEISPQEAMNSFQATFQSLGLFFDGLTPVQQVALVAVPLLTFLTGSLYSLSFQDTRQGLEPYARGEYDAVAARAFYRRYPLTVLQRVLQVLRRSNGFVFRVLLDKYVFKKEEQNRPQRAQELLRLLQDLGPTAIKIGQALSVRPDLVATEYATALSSLQDAVPPFDTAEARRICQDLPVQLSSDPVASASIGQVYKCTYQDQTVAVKVQRPNVLAEIALDVFITKEFAAPIYQRITKSATDYAALANEWGRGFIGELDYQEEARKTQAFTAAMAERGLSAVCAPTVVADTETVLVTKWVDGTRLDQSQADDVPRLCSVALNAYLCMLLELQSLHCDPHPGNLLRTTDGKLCILDWGMTLEVGEESNQLQYALLEYVAHLTAQEYDALPDDLVRLGFLKKEKVDFVRRSGVLEPLKYFLQQASAGGGADKVRERIFDEYRAKYPGLSEDELRVEMRAEMKTRMQEIVERETVSTGITMQVEELQKQNADSFKIPEWFLYTSRAFLTLEGVSLAADPNYSIIQSCFPYVAKRLVGDNDPRAAKALKDLIYGAAGVVDIDRLADLADGFTSYTTTSKRNNKVEKDGFQLAESTVTLVKDSADVLLSPDGNVMQNLLLEESALAASATFKDRVRENLVDGPQRLRDSLPFGSILPKLPFEQEIEPFVRKSESELKAQDLADKLLSRFSTSSSETTSTPSTDSFIESLRELDPEQAALVLKELRVNVPVYAPLVGQLGNKFATRLLQTANGSLESTIHALEKDGKALNPALEGAVKGLTSAAERGVSVLEGSQTK